MTMGARKWTPVQRAQQAVKIHSWQPWAKSTGPQSPEGKLKSSQNAKRFTYRKLAAFTNWIGRQGDRQRAGKSYASLQEIERRMRQCDIPVG